MTTRRRQARRLAALLALAALSLGLAACGGSGGRDRTLTVLAAASLTGSYTELAHDFEKDHPDVDVRLVFDSSATLADKAVDRAPGDVLATADEKTMDDAIKRGGTQGTPREFATNIVVVAVPKDDPAHVREFADLQQEGVDYVTCVTTAPCGAAAQALLDGAGITHEPVSQEVDVKAVLAKVADGEADAGLVYRTDVTAAADKVRGIPVPGAAQHPNTYWIAVTRAAGDKQLAQAWISSVLDQQGRHLLARSGFGPPDKR